jgi:hypothetical protein
MSTPERLKGRIEPFLGAVLLSVVLIQVKRFLPGVGGSLGLAAFVTVWLLVTLKRIMSRPALPDRNETLRPPSLDGDAELVQPGERVITPCVVHQDSATTRAFAAASAKPMRTIGGAGLAALALGCLLLPSKQTEVLDMTAASQVASEPTPVAQQLALLQTSPAPETGQPFEAPSVAPANSDVTPERTSVERAVDSKGQTAEPPAASSLQTITDVSTLHAPEPASGGVAPGAAGSDSTLFREFRQWLASRPLSVAEARPQPLRRDRHRTQVAGVTTAASTPQPRARERQSDRLTPPAAIPPAQVQHIRARRPVAQQTVVQPSIRQSSP